METSFPNYKLSILVEIQLVMKDWKPLQKM